MAIDTVVPRSRRAILAGALGGLAAAAAATVTRQKPARASNGDAIILGTSATAPLDGTGPNEATSTTLIYTTAGYGLHAISAGNGLRGQSDSFVGVEGSSQSSVGVFGSSVSGSAVSGSSSSGYGVRGFSNAADRPGTGGLSGGSGTGVFGYSDPNASTPPATPAKTGVYGRAVQDASSRGVTGESTAGRGVNGIATSGTGVYGSASGGEGVHGESTGSSGVAGYSAAFAGYGVFGENTNGGYGTYGRSNVGQGIGVGGDSANGIGVYGQSPTGIGVQATSSDGIALDILGRVRFSTAGLITVGVGAKSKTIAPGVDIGTGSLILCTLESNQAGLFIHRVLKNVEADTFKVFLSAAVAAGKTARIGWFVIG